MRKYTQNESLCGTYQPDRRRSECWPQTCHIWDVCWWEPTVYAGFSLSLQLWWVMGVCSLKTQVRDITSDSQGQNTKWLHVNVNLYQQMLYLWVGGPPVQSWSWHWNWGPQSDPSAYSAILKGAVSPWTLLLDSKARDKENSWMIKVFWVM